MNLVAVDIGDWPALEEALREYARDHFEARVVTIPEVGDVAHLPRGVWEDMRRSVEEADDRPCRFARAADGCDCGGKRWKCTNEEALQAMECPERGWNDKHCREYCKYRKEPVAKVSETVKYNLGCGEDVRDDHVNVDIREIDGAVKHDCADVSGLVDEYGTPERVVAMDVLEHLSWRVADDVLRRWCEALAEDGTLYVQVPNCERFAESLLGDGDLDKVRSDFFGGQGYEEDTHRTLFTEERLIEIVESAGLEVDKSYCRRNIMLWAHKEADKPEVRIYGMRRTGTNYLADLLERNYRCEVLGDKEGGWKHGTHRHEREYPEAHVAVCVRNPLSWLPSLHRIAVDEKHADSDMPFHEWAAGDWMRQGDQDSPLRWEGHRGWAPRVHDWNKTYGYWLWRGVPIVRYEELLEEPEQTCEKLVDGWGLKRTTDSFDIPQRYVGPYKRNDGREGVLQRHRQATYMDLWDEASLEALERTADPLVLEELGYSLEVPESNEVGDILWIMRGGAGDLVMLAYGMRMVLNSGREIDLWAGRRYSGWLAPIFEDWEGLNVLEEKPEAGSAYRSVVCDCGRSTLEKRAQELEYDELITPNGHKGTPADWGYDLADQLMDEDADRSRVYNILNGQLPHARVPKNVLIGPGTGSGPNSEKKHWSGWREVCGSAPQTFIWLGEGDSCPHPPEWDECPVCGGELVDGAKKQYCSSGCGWCVVDKIGRTPTPRDVLAEMADAALYVGIDNGLGHLAAGCGLPTISVFVETSPERFRPNTCNSLTFGGKGDPPDGSDVAEAVSRMEGNVAEPLVSVVIATHNEGDELLRTVECARLKAGCDTEVIVVDDGGTDDSVARLPEWVRTTRNEERTGVAPARQQGSQMARGDVLVFWDGHMRWSRNCARKMAAKALADECVVMAPLKNLYGSDRDLGGAEFTIKADKGRLGSQFVGIPEDGRYQKKGGFVAPCYAIPRDIFERIGGWPGGLQNWGQTEITLSLKLAMAEVPIVMDSEVQMWHDFRGSFPYSGVSTKDLLRNNYRMCRICFDRGTFETFWLPLMRTHKFFDENCEEWTDEDEQERIQFREVKTLSDKEFFERVLNTSIENAKEEYLDG